MSLAERFDAMNRQITHKRVRGDGEAGESASGLNDGTPGLLLTMDDLKQLPKVELVTEFKCIEGWSQIVHWGGVRLRDLIEAYPPAKVNGREPRYVYMETPNGNYYGGYDMAAARHPQSLLVMEMGGQPLPQEHGAPLRLHMPIKYGYKQVKRIGLIAYMDERPDDYWTKLGYDWYAGL
jgi:DMSO/TMAO reductase YedYZ molybdopterin-dependent catalytic subunit